MFSNGFKVFLAAFCTSALGFIYWKSKSLGVDQAELVVLTCAVPVVAVIWGFTGLSRLIRSIKSKENCLKDYEKVRIERAAKFQMVGDEAGAALFVIGIGMLEKMLGVAFLFGFFYNLFNETTSIQDKVALGLLSFIWFPFPRYVNVIPMTIARAICTSAIFIYGISYS